MKVAKRKPANENGKQTDLPSKNKKVFIVHGHDEAAQLKTVEFILKLGLDPVILHDQASFGGTIIEKIDLHTNVRFAIVLYTPCDIGGKKVSNPDLKDRARQNVVFEHGYLIAKIGRRNVCALVKGAVEIPTDLSGIVYVSMEDNDVWKIRLARELKNSGYRIDLNILI